MTCQPDLFGLLQETRLFATDRAPVLHCFNRIGVYHPHIVAFILRDADNVQRPWLTSPAIRNIDDDHSVDTRRRVALDREFRGIRRDLQDGKILGGPLRPHQRVSGRS